MKRKPLYQGPLPSIHIQNDTGAIQIIQPQTAWRYLGFIFNPSLTFKTHVEQWVTKGSTTLRACKMLGNSQRGLTPRDKQLIYITTALPILSYGYQLWFHHKSKHCKGLIQRLNQVHTATARWITRGFPGCNAKALQYMAGLQPLHITLEKLYHNSAICNKGLHHSTGIAQSQKTPIHLTAQSTG